MWNGLRDFFGNRVPTPVPVSVTAPRGPAALTAEDKRKQVEESDELLAKSLIHDEDAVFAQRLATEEQIPAELLYSSEDEQIPTELLKPVPSPKNNNNNNNNDNASQNISKAGTFLDLDAAAVANLLENFEIFSKECSIRCGNLRNVNFNQFAEAYLKLSKTEQTQIRKYMKAALADKGQTFTNKFNDFGMLLENPEALARLQITSSSEIKNPITEEDADLLAALKASLEGNNNNQNNNNNNRIAVEEPKEPVVAPMPQLTPEQEIARNKCDQRISTLVRFGLNLKVNEVKALYPPLENGSCEMKLAALQTFLGILTDYEKSTKSYSIDDLKSYLANLDPQEKRALNSEKGTTNEEATEQTAKKSKITPK